MCPRRTGWVHRAYAGHAGAVTADERQRCALARSSTRSTSSLFMLAPYQHGAILAPGPSGEKTALLSVWG